MSLESYKLIHFISLILVTSSLGVSYFCKPPEKWSKYLGIIASLFLMIAGMGLLARIMPGLSWPIWIKIKLGIWLTIAISGPMLAKRLTKYRGHAFIFLMLLFSIAIMLAVYKPLF